MRLLFFWLALALTAGAQTTYTNDPFPLFNTVRNGVGAPTSLIGNDGDFYIDTTANAQKIYGPRYLGNWGSGTSIVGGAGSSCGAATSSVLGCILIPANSGLAVDGSGNLVVSLAFTAPLVRTGPTVSINQANATTDGYLGHSDWNRFNTVANGSWLPDPGINGLVVRTSANRDTTLTAPLGTIVGTTDTQTLTNKTVDGVSPATFSFLDATSSIQNQLNGKQAGLSFTGTGSKTVTATAAGNSGHCVQWTSAGDIGDAGAACGSSGGTTSPGGTNGQIEYNNGGAFGGLTIIPATNMPAHTGDVTSPSGSTVNTLATVNSSPGTFGSSTLCPTFTVNGKGLVTAASQSACAGGGGTAGITQLTGDVTTPSSSSGSTAATLATVNSNVGSFGDSTHTVTLTVDAKGRITAVSTNAISGGGGGSSDVTIGTLWSMPATCSAGALYFATDQPAGQQLYGCSATNTWTEFNTLGSSGALAYTGGVLDIVTSVLPRLSAANTFLGLNAFQNGIQFTTLATGQPSCTSSTPGMIWYNGTSAGAAESLQACLWNGSAYGWSSLASSGGGGGSYTAGSGLTLSGSAFSLTSPIAASFLPALTGDVTTSAGAVATTLATVNSAPGTTGDASHTTTITTNGKGLVTSNSSNAISITHSQVSDFAAAASADAPVQSFNTRTGAVVPASGDYTAAQVTNAAATNAANTFSANQTISANVAIGMTATTTNAVLINGSITTVGLSTPTTPTYTLTGTSGTSSDSYCVVANQLDGSHTSCSTILAILTAPATLNGTNYITLSWTAVTNAYSYSVYRTLAGGVAPTTTGLIATVTTTNYSDQGASGDLSSFPVQNTTGQLVLGSGIKLGYQPGSAASNGLWLGSTIPTVSNYSLLGTSSGDTIINTQGSSNTIHFRIGGNATDQLSISTSGGAGFANNVFAGSGKCFYFGTSGTAGVCDDGSSGINLVTNGVSRLNLSSTGGWTVHGALVGLSSPNLGGSGFAWGTTYTNLIQTTARTFSNLATCTSTLEGTSAAVTDSTTATYGATITGSGSNHIKAYCNGTNWVVD